MGKDKTNIGFSMNKDIWDLAKVVLPCSRSEFIEKQLIKYINSVDDIEVLEKEIKEMEAELNVKKQKLNHMKKIRENNSKNEENINKAMKTITNIILNNSCVTEEQIKFIANSNNLLKEVLKEEIKNKGYKII